MTKEQLPVQQSAATATEVKLPVEVRIRAPGMPCSSGGDVAPADRNLTGYDEQRLVTYLRLLDADGVDWQEVAKIVLHIDPEREPDRAMRGRAIWPVRSG